MVITIGLLFFVFVLKQTYTKQFFFVIQSTTPNTILFNRFLNTIENGVFSIGSLIAIFIADPIEYHMNGVPIIISKKQSILMIPMNHSSITMRND